MRAPVAADGLRALRRRIAAIEGARPAVEAARLIRLGLAPVDQALGGGLALGALHEVAPPLPIHRGAAFGSTLAPAARAVAEQRAELLWIETLHAAAETGRPYGLGLDAYGVPPDRVLVVRVRRQADLLWVLEEALGSRGIAVAIAEIADAEIDLTATRRLALAARQGGGLGLIVRHRAAPEPSAALTRWQIAAARSPPDRFGGLGPSCFDLTLAKNRHGPCGRWTVLWDHHDRAFQALSVGVAAASVDRPDRARLARVG
jgi:protein ImuA